MKTSETITKITPAFLAAQKKIESVIKDATNPYYRSKYADLTAVIGACKDELNKNGIAILQPIDGMTVETVLVHESGEWFSSLTPIVCKSQNDPQALGSAITYSKRYGLQSMVLLPAEDDDGNRATQLKSEEVKDPTEAWKVPNNDVSEDDGLVTADHFCLIHKVEMKERKATSGGTFYDHRAKLNGDLKSDSVNGKWYMCDGKHDWRLSQV